MNAVAHSIAFAIAFATGWVLSTHTELVEVPVTRFDWAEFAAYFTALFLIGKKLLGSAMTAIVIAGGIAGYLSTFTDIVIEEEETHDYLEHACITGGIYAIAVGAMTHLQQQPKHGKAQ